MHGLSRVPSPLVPFGHSTGGAVGVGAGAATSGGGAGAAEGAGLALCFDAASPDESSLEQPTEDSPSINARQTVTRLVRCDIVSDSLLTPLMKTRLALRYRIGELWCKHPMCAERPRTLGLARLDARAATQSPAPAPSPLSWATPWVVSSLPGSPGFAGRVSDLSTTLGKLRSRAGPRERKHLHTDMDHSSVKHVESLRRSAREIDHAPATNKRPSIGDPHDHAPFGGE